MPKYEQIADQNAASGADEIERERRPLTEEEQQFVREAEAGHFGVGYDDDGKPYAMGAPKTGNLFDVDVEEIDDAPSRGSIYRLRY